MLTPGVDEFFGRVHLSWQLRPHTDPVRSPLPIMDPVHALKLDGIGDPGAPVRQAFLKMEAVHGMNEHPEGRLKVREGSKIRRFRVISNHPVAKVESFADPGFGFLADAKIVVGSVAEIRSSPKGLPGSLTGQGPPIGQVLLAIGLAQGHDIVVKSILQPGELLGGHGFRARHQKVPPPCFLDLGNHVRMAKSKLPENGLHAVAANSLPPSWGETKQESEDDQLVEMHWEPI